jgi:hypothetical protein
MSYPSLVIVVTREMRPCYNLHRPVAEGVAKPPRYQNTRVIVVVVAYESVVLKT